MRAKHKAGYVTLYNSREAMSDERYTSACESWILSLARISFRGWIDDQSRSVQCTWDKLDVAVRRALKKMVEKPRE